VRQKLPSLAALSDAQLEAVMNSFDADGSGVVDPQVGHTLSFTLQSGAINRLVRAMAGKVTPEFTS